MARPGACRGKRRVSPRWTTLQRAPCLIAGSVLAWARALGEFGASIIFAGNVPGVTQAMPLAIDARFGAGHLPAALLLSVILLVASLSQLLGGRAVGGRVPGGRWVRAPVVEEEGVQPVCIALEEADVQVPERVRSRRATRLR